MDNGTQDQIGQGIGDISRNVEPPKRAVSLLFKDKTPAQVEATINDYAFGKSELPNDEVQLREILVEAQKRQDWKFDLQMFAKQVESRLAELRQTYGVIPKGEAPRLRDAQVPAATEEGKTRKFARTAAEILPEDSSKAVLKGVENNEFAYTPISNKATIGKAEVEVNADFETAYRKFKGSIDSGKRITADDIALGEVLLTRAAKEGNAEMSKRLTIDLAAELTNAGQTVQAARLLKKMSPEGYSVYLQRQIDRVNRDYSKKFGEKFKNIELTDAERKAIIEAPTVEERERIGLDVAARVAKELPVTFMEKFNSWRRIAMLFNPKTHIRNILGNTVFIPLRKTADAIGAGLEKYHKIPVSQRTKSLGWQKDSGIVKTVDESWNSVKGNMSNSGRWDLGKVLGREKEIFKTKKLEELNKLSGSLLETEDVWFLEKAYKDALGQHLKASKKTKTDDQAVNYAIRKALEATYRDTSKLATTINELKRRGGIVGTALEATMPFTKTPINVAKRGIEYSPFGLGKGLIQEFGKVKKGQVSATEAIENISKGLTGTGALLVGIVLAKMGIIIGAAPSDRDMAEFDRVKGKQPFSIRLGSDTYTWDWMQPVSMPIAMGVQIYEKIKGNDNLVNAVIDSAGAGLDTLFNLPIFQGVKRTLTGYARSSEQGAESAANALFGIFDSYAQQTIPVVGSQLARTIDPTVRTTYTPKTGKGIVSSFGNRAERFARVAASKTPGLTFLLPAKVDVWGKEVKQPKNVAARAGLNFLSPGFYGKGKENAVTKEVDKVYQLTGEKGIFPRVAPKYFMYDKKRYDLTPEQYTKMQKYMGEVTLERFKDLVGSGMSAEDKAAEMKRAIDDSYDEAKEKIMDEMGIEPKLKFLARRPRRRKF